MATCPGQTGPTLVDKLVECMLAVGPWLPPHNGACLVVHPGTGLGDVLSIGLHVALEGGQKLSPLPTRSAFHKLPGSFLGCPSFTWGAH